MLLYKYRQSEPPSEAMVFNEILICHDYNTMLIKHQTNQDIPLMMSVPVSETCC